MFTAKLLEGRRDGQGASCSILAALETIYPSWSSGATSQLGSERTADVWRRPSQHRLRFDWSSPRPNRASHPMTGEWLTHEQRRTLIVSSAVPEPDGARPFRSAAQLGVSPVVCGRLVTMLLLEAHRPATRTEDGTRTIYRIAQAGLAALVEG